MWVLIVFTDTDSSVAISGRDRLVGRYRSTLSSPELSCVSPRGATPRGAPGLGGLPAPPKPPWPPRQEIKDVGEQRGVRGPVPRQGLEQLPRAGYREREH
jgi:hypothetical protein